MAFLLRTGRLSWLMVTTVFCAIAGSGCAEREVEQATWWQTPVEASPIARNAEIRPLDNVAKKWLLERTIEGLSVDAWTPSHTNYQIIDDAPVGYALCTPADKPLTLDGKLPYSGNREIRAKVRFRPAGANSYAYFTFARRQVQAPDPKDATKTIAKTTNFRLLISAAKTPASVSASVQQDNAALFDLKNYEKLDWTPALSSQYSYRLRAFEQFLPGWPEQFRAQVEHDMAELPLLADKWVAIRVELRKGEAMFWIDDRLVARKADASIEPDGTMSIDLGAGAQLAGFTTRAITDSPALKGFRPIPLAGYVNARAFVDNSEVVHSVSLPPANEPAMVNGVPFVFPGTNSRGNDHIDVGRSLLRQGNLTGYIPAMHGHMARWIGSAEGDPARIQLRIGNGQFNALHLVAASDGEEFSIPSVTAMFYRPGAGFPHSFSAAVPLASVPGEKALPVTLANGKRVYLHHVVIPLDPGLLSSFGDMDIVEVELTKNVQLYRTYPDPISYSYHQAGRPSGVHVYAATLQETPVMFDWKPAIFGHVWQSPAQPAYIATLSNNSAAAQTGKLIVTTRSFDGTEETKAESNVSLPAPGKAAPVPVAVTINLPVKLFGYHDVKATLTIGDKTWTETRSMVKLAPDTRSVRWTPGRGAMFGFWSYGAGHNGPKMEHHVRVMTMAGARASIGYPTNLPPDAQALVNKHWSAAPAGAWEVSPQAWAAVEPIDQAKAAAFTKDILEKFHKTRDPIPADHRPDHVYFYPEPGISPRLSAGNAPEYWGEKPYELTDDEKTRLRMFFNTSKIAAEAVKKEFPGIKVFIPYGDPGFIWPLLRENFPKNLIDGSGFDIPGFERIPERQLHEQSIHRTYWVKKEYEKAGIPNPDLRLIEGIFVPTEPGAVTWREQMDIYHRTTLLLMAYGMTQFYSSWFAYDCTNYYGAEHYGGCGIQNKIPYANPKPAYAAYATMTDKLNEANFDGWVKTGSTSTYALRFKKADNKGFVYALWTITGRRPVTLTLDADALVSVTDSMNNTKTLQSASKQVTVSTDASVIYITLPTATGVIAAAQVGEPDHSDSKPAPDAKLVANLGDGAWQFTNEKDTILETNHWGMMHYAGKFSAETAQDAAHGKVLTTQLESQNTVHELMPWYNVLRPKGGAITLEGAPAKLGLWVKGASDWGRFIYVLRDAKGERWESIGAKDDYNCDDVHSWSQFHFDGWRYLTFELPGHTGWDSFRKHGTTWWRSDEGDGVVDLPLKLEAVVVEQRSHLLYVNDVQPASSNRVSFGKMFVEYETPFDATRAAVSESKLRMPMPKRIGELPNPIADMARDGVGAATTIVRIRPPEHEYDGTRAHIDFKEVEGAKAYYLWCSAHADGQGAVNMVPAGIKNGQLVRGFRPAIKLYYWIVYADKDGKLSKPSPVVEQVLIDAFKEK